MSVIETEELTKQFGHTLAVDELTFSVEAGQIFGFLGPNGSGKTTTIGMLLGVIYPTSGTFRVLGASSPRDLRCARQRVGATLEAPNFYPYLSGLDNLRMVAELKGVGSRKIGAVLETVGLSRRGEDKFSGYSQGMKQRLALGATLLGDPELVVLDEPMKGLDPAGIRETRDLIAALAAEGTTIFLSGHLLHEVEQSCTDVAILRHGRLIHQGPVKDLLSQASAWAIRSENPAALLRALREYSAVREATCVGGEIVARLDGNDSASLNRFLAHRGIFVSEMTQRGVTLEDVFIELTTSDGAAILD